jgi:hypothetical protein
MEDYIVNTSQQNLDPIIPDEEKRPSKTLEVPEYEHEKCEG